MNWDKTTCPHCGKEARTYHASAFVGNFKCDHCGAYNSGDVGCSPPGYYRDEDGQTIHYVTQKELDRSRDCIEILYGKPRVMEIRLPVRVLLPDKPAVDNNEPD